MLVYYWLKWRINGGFKKYNLYFLDSQKPILYSQAFGRALGRPSGFQADIVQNFTYPNSSSQNVYTRFEHFYSFVALQILHRKPLNREKNDFSKADLGI